MRLPVGKIHTVSCDSIFARDLFDALAAFRQKDLAPKANSVSFLPAVMVFHAGEKPGSIYLHISGRAVVLDGGSTDGSGDAYAVDANRVYGLIEVLSESSFHAGLRTITNCDFDIIRGEDFLEFIKDRPILTFRIATLIARLHRQTLREIRGH